MLRMPARGLLSLSPVDVSKKKNRDEQEYCLLIKRRNRFLLPSSMVVRLHKKCTYSGLIFSVAFVACACAGYLSKSCSLQVQRLQVALSLTSILYFPWAEPRGPQHKQMNCGFYFLLQLRSSSFILHCHLADWSITCR